MDDRSPTPGTPGEPVRQYQWPLPEPTLAQAEPARAEAARSEVWPGFDAGMPPPPDFPLPPSPGSRPPARRRRAVLAGLIAAALLLSGVIGVTGGALWHNDRATTASQGAPPITTSPSGVSAAAAAVAASVAPALVNVNTFTDSGSIGTIPLGAGTGMILSSTGEVLTNNHVVEGASKIEVVVAGHSGSYTADVVGVDPTQDVALLQLQDASGLPTIAIGTTSGVTQGQDVIAMGNALGVGGAPSVTTGTISSLHRSITARNPSGESEQLSDLIQTDAAIQPGDSGGALVNASGQVIGMITAGAAPGGDSQVPSTVGFAIPLDNALPIVFEIRAGHGSATILLGDRGFLGVIVNRNFDFSTAPGLGIDATSGAFVRSVEPGSAAEAAGIKGPAVITAVGGQAVTSTDDLGPLLHVHAPGEHVQVTWVDASGSHTATVTLGTGPAV